MNEHAFIRSIHKKIPKKVTIWKINDVYQGGVPDAMYLGKQALWVEYKYIKALPKRESTIIRHSLTEQQTLWLNKLNSAGTQAVLVLGSPSKCYIIPSNFDQPISVKTYKKHCVSINTYVDWLVNSTTV